MLDILLKDSKMPTVFGHVEHSLYGDGLAVKALDSQSRGPVFKTTGWLQGWLSLSPIRIFLKKFYLTYLGTSSEETMQYLHNYFDITVSRFRFAPYTHYSF